LAKSLFTAWNWTKSVRYGRAKEKMILLQVPLMRSKCPSTVVTVIFISGGGDGGGSCTKISFD